MQSKSKEARSIAVAKSGARGISDARIVGERGSRSPNSGVMSTPIALVAMCPEPWLIPIVVTGRWIRSTLQIFQMKPWRSGVQPVAERSSGYLKGGVALRRSDTEPSRDLVTSRRQVHLTSCDPSHVASKPHQAREDVVQHRKRDMAASADVIRVSRILGSQETRILRPGQDAPDPA